MMIGQSQKWSFQAAVTELCCEELDINVADTVLVEWFLIE